MSHRRVKNMPRYQQKAVMRKIRPSYPSRSNTKGDIKRIHRESGSSDQAKQNYNRYRSRMIQHMDRTEVKQYKHDQRREDRAVKKAEKQDRREQEQNEKEKQIEQNYDRNNEDVSNSDNSYEG